MSGVSESLLSVLLVTCLCWELGHRAGIFVLCSGIQKAARGCSSPAPAEMQHPAAPRDLLGISGWLWTGVRLGREEPSEQRACRSPI